MTLGRTGNPIRLRAGMIVWWMGDELVRIIYGDKQFSTVERLDDHRRIYGIHTDELRALSIEDRRILKGKI